jgi:chromosome segregation ATPase
MNEDPTKDLSQRAFQQRALAEFASIRSEVGELRGEVGELRGEVGELRGEVAELRTQQTAMAKNLAALDRRLTSLEEKVDNRLKETRPIWEAVKAQIEKLDAKFDNFIRDLYDLRGDLRMHEKRLDSLDRRVPS